MLISARMERHAFWLWNSPVVATAIEDMLNAAGMETVGPHGNMAEALNAAEDEPLQAAIVDLNIRGAKTYSLFSVLERRKVPFLMVSGYADWSMPDAWQDRPRLPKPFSETQLRSDLHKLLVL